MKNTVGMGGEGGEKSDCLRFNRGLKWSRWDRIIHVCRAWSESHHIAHQLLKALAEQRCWVTMHSGKVSRPRGPRS